MGAIWIESNLTRDLNLTRIQTWLVIYNVFYQINYDAIQGFPALRKAVTTHMKKKKYFFTCVWYRQSAADTSLAFRTTRSGWWMNGKAFTILNPRSLSEHFRIMATKKIKNAYHLQTVTFELS